MFISEHCASWICAQLSGLPSLASITVRVVPCSASTPTTGSAATRSSDDDDLTSDSFEARSVSNPSDEAALIAGMVNAQRPAVTSERSLFIWVKRLTFEVSRRHRLAGGCRLDRRVGAHVFQGRIIAPSAELAKCFLCV